MTNLQKDQSRPIERVACMGLVRRGQLRPFAFAPRRDAFTREMSRAAMTQEHKDQQHCILVVRL